MLDLGAPVNLAAGALDIDDFNFEFALSTGEIMEGIVEFGPLPTASSPGDFDNDGDVDGRDFLVWQRGGSPNPLSSGDLALWQSNYAAPLAAEVASVPNQTHSSLQWSRYTYWLTHRARDKVVDVGRCLSYIYKGKGE